MTLTIILATLFVLFASLFLVPLNIRVSNRLKIVAQPDPRKIHNKRTPEAGGLSFGLPILLVQIVLGILWYKDYGLLLPGLAITGLFALVFGALDDRYELKPWPKLGGYLILCIILYGFGYRVLYLTNPFGTEINLGWLSFPASILWFLAIINAINLIDGIDGLAAGITVIVCAVLTIVGISSRNILVISIATMLLAGNLSFLKYNFAPAKIFMGDTGATFIGLNLAAITTAGEAQYKGITSITLIVPLAVMAVPMLDVVLAVFRRLRKGAVFTADKAHIHHAMLDLGLSHQTISIIVYIVTLLFGLIAIGFSFTGKQVLFLVLLGLLSLMVILAYILMRQELKNEKDTTLPTDTRPKP
ncbi:MAG: MraY family glycosyltransferase [Candidatus Cloacimonadota bacterium]